MSDIEVNKDASGSKKIVTVTGDESKSLALMLRKSGNDEPVETKAENCERESYKDHTK